MSYVSRDDATVGASLGRVGGEGFVSIEVLVLLNGKTERTMEFTQLAHADKADFGESHSEVTEAVGDVVWSKLGKEPGALGVGGKEFDDGLVIDVGVARVIVGDLRLAVGEKLFVLGFGEECHGCVPYVSGPLWSGHRDRRTKGVREEPNRTTTHECRAKAKSIDRDSALSLARSMPEDQCLAAACRWGNHTTLRIYVYSKVRRRSAARRRLSPEGLGEVANRALRRESRGIRIFESPGYSCWPWTR
jgi:hypothetical protein